MLKRTLITGAGGQVGHATVTSLARRGVPVMAAVHTPETAGHQEWEGDVEVVHFDWKDHASWNRALVGVDRVMLIAPPGADNQYDLLLPAIERIRDEGIIRFVLLTFMGADQVPDAPLRQLEQHLMRTGSDWTFLRPNWFMQNFSGFLAPMIREGQLALPTGEGKTSFVDVRDIGDVAAVVLSEDGHTDKAYTLTGPEAFSHKDVAAIISEETGTTIDYLPLTDDDGKERLVSQGTDPAYAEMLVAMYDAVRQGWNEPVSDDVEQLTGQPARGFHSYVREHRDEWI